MVDLLKVGIFQFNIKWKDVLANRFKIENQLSNLKSIPDLLILPEMYTTGFSDIPSGVDINLLNGQYDWQLNLSKKFQVALMGSIVVPESNHFKNRLLFTKSDGTSNFYDKRHLFYPERKSGNYIAGNDRRVFELNGITIMPQICYDLRFPVWSRNTKDLDYQLLVYVSNWPSIRERAWETLLPARAIENQSFVIGVNRVGEDGNNIYYNGGSMVISPEGDCIVKLGELEEYAEVSLSMLDLKTFRNEFPVYRDADKFTLNFE